MKTHLLLATLCLLAPLQAKPDKAAAPAPAPAAPVAEEAPQYIRVQNGGTATMLQTAVVHLKKGKTTVDLVGAVHIADKEYYEGLNTLFTSYDALLYEGVGSGFQKKPAAEEQPAPAEEEGKTPARKSGALGGLHTAYENGARWLGLSYQMKVVDYSKDNFVHADLSFADFTRLQKERGESLFKFMMKAGQASKDAKNRPKEPNSLKLLVSIVAGDKDGLKRELVGTLGAGDDQVSAIAGESVIITDRNTKCLEVMDRELATGKKKLGIFYGAAHFPDMVKRLEEGGWQVTGTSWRTAWHIAEKLPAAGK